MSKFPFKPNPPYIPDPYVIPQQKEKVDEMKTPEEQARGYVWHNYGEGDFNEYNWDRSAEEIWLAGYKAAKQEYEAKIQELETQLENWQHNAVHGDEGL